MRKSELKAIIKECIAEELGEAYNEYDGEEMEDGRGRYKASYTKGRDIGSDRFGNKNVAIKYARGMKKRGYDVDLVDLQTRKGIKFN